MLYIFYYSNNYNYFIEYINTIMQNIVDKKFVSINKILNLNEFIINNNNNNNNDNNNNQFLFIFNIPPQIDILKLISYSINIYLINTEQTTKENEKIKIINYYNNGVKIIDYSMQNIHILSENVKNIIYMPYIPNNVELNNNYKKFGVCMINANKTHSKKRQYIHDELKKKINLINIHDFGQKRDAILFNCKILVNIHIDDNYRIFEQIRCNRCIYNKIIVITEKSDDIDYELKKYIIECDYNDIVNVTTNVLKNYKEYYDNLFGNFNIDEINKLYIKYEKIPL